MTLALEVDTTPLRTDKDGVVRVGMTRVTLDTVVAAFKEGNTAEEILEQYPALNLADVYLTIGYYLRQRAAVEHYLEERQEQARRVETEYAALLNQEGLRDRLLARRANKQS